MAFDGIVTKAITAEISELNGARIDKVFQPNKNEILLGINPCIYGLNYHDPSVVVFINGEVVFGIEEERCNRIKGSKGMFPSSAIKQSLIHCNLTWDDIDAIVIGYDPALWMDRLNLEILDIIQKCKNDILKQA